MTIRCFRFYLQYKDTQISQQMALSHSGAAGWFEKRLKTIREQLKGPEVKGVDIVNIFFLEEDEKKPEWKKLLNSFECRVSYDLQSLISRPPIENLQNLIEVASELCYEAPWPQVQTIGRLLAQPLNDSDLISIENYLIKWAAYVKELQKNPPPIPNIE